MSGKVDLLGQLWAGRVYGTNTGNLFIKFETSDRTVTGTLRFMDAAFGLTVYQIDGSFDEVLRLRGVPLNRPDELEPIEVTAVLTSQGALRGEWQSEAGTAGTFEAYPHDLPPPDQRTAEAVALPLQLFTSNVTLGAVRLYAEEVIELIQVIRKDFVVGRPVVTYAVRGNEVTKFAEDFERETTSLGQLRYFKVAIQESQAYGINKVVVVELNARGSNEIRVQGIDETWVMGKVEAIARFTRKFEKGLVTTYRKFGLELNSLIFAIMLVVMPEIAPLWKRGIFVGFVFAVLVSLLWLHRRFIPSVVLYLTEQKPTFVQRVRPTVVSWLVAMTATLAGAILFRWLTNKMP